MSDKKKKTIFQSLGSALFYGFDKNVEDQQNKIRSYTINNDTPIFKTKDKDEYERTMNQIKQEKYLASQWVGAGINLGQTTSLVSNNLKLMYRDCDIMDNYPEIGAALDIYAEESVVCNTKGQILNITSNSDRIKKVLDDLFVNRLDIHTNLPMWTRSMCKYGNAFILLNIVDKNGIIGARQLPVYEIERVENGVYNPYLSVPSNYNANKETEFIWVGQSMGMPFKSWQIAHFRLLTDSLFLPYGVSVLHKARRHFRILSMMEDMMLIYRLERGIERRVFKIYVGNIDDADIPAYVQGIANTFKRTPIIDPETGQLDLRKTSMSIDQDIFYPVKDISAPNPVDTLQPASNLDKIEDLKFIQGKVLTALRIPREFLNFDETAGDGKNLAIKDIRFTRTINRIQQALIMELTKVAVIHLYLNGFIDELTNFKITMNSPSTQSEILKLEELSKKISLVTASVIDPGTGIPIMSMTRAQREILGWSDAEIKQNMLEIRLENALAGEIRKTEQIIKRSHIFDEIDDIYGEPNAEYTTGEMDDSDGSSGGSGGGGLDGFGDDFGDSSDSESYKEGGIEGMDIEETSSLVGSENEVPDIEVPDIEGNESNTKPSENEELKLESMSKTAKRMITENKEKIIKKVYKERKDKYLKAYLKYLNESNKKEDYTDIVPIINENLIKNDEMNNMIEELKIK